MIIMDVLTDSFEPRLWRDRAPVNFAKRTGYGIWDGIQFSRQVFDGKIVLLERNCPTC